MSDAKEAAKKANGDKSQPPGIGKKSAISEEKANKAADKQGISIAASSLMNWCLMFIAADLDYGVEKFRNVSDRLGGADKAKIFFDLYGPQDLAPAKKEHKESNDFSKTSDRAKELAKELKLETTIQVWKCLQQRQIHRLTVSRIMVNRS